MQLQTTMLPRYVDRKMYTSYTPLSPKYSHPTHGLDLIPTAEKWQRTAAECCPSEIRRNKGVQQLSHPQWKGVRAHLQC